MYRLRRTLFLCKVVVCGVVCVEQSRAPHQCEVEGNLRVRCLNELVL